MTSVNVSKCKNKYDFYAAVIQATAIGTMQASMTDFSYIHPDFKKNSESEALLGVSMTGIAENWELLTAEVLENGAKLAVETNKEWAALLGIKPAKRITCVKPEGSGSIVLGSTSGIHAAHAEFYLRRVRFAKTDRIAQYLAKKAPELIEDEILDKYNVVLTAPVKMQGAILRDEETAIQLLDRMKHINRHWIQNAHIEGDNTHNVSLTVNYHEHERQDIVSWMLKNRDFYTGISLLPFDGGSYKQLPFEAITEEQYNEWCKKIPEDLDFQEINFKGTVDKRSAEAACSGNSCEIT